MAGGNKTIHVYADWAGLGGAKRMGLLSTVLVRGKEVFSFTYHEEWLKAGHTQRLDPVLQFYSGPQ